VVLPKKQIQQAAAHLSGGDPERGRGKILYYGCPSCHTIPGVMGANGLVGPSLKGLANRVYIAGVLPNNPDNLVRWIQHPKQVDEKTAMPDLNVTASDARDIAGYLYTLQ
jgi:cytochrome c2